MERAFFLVDEVLAADFLPAVLARDFTADVRVDVFFDAAFLTGAFFTGVFFVTDFLVVAFLTDAFAGALFRTAFLDAAFFFIAIRSLLRSC
ncbi:hypothetical protein [Acidiferrobacter sp.]|uniref:hypothetical protein n=1 Tax=Acidiferrobacter sp. TaxID=1872107 RepID=UPI002620FA40|nr:hypothetical protein [Acidiferrobacter sp.]